jgi:hypothetical protein
VDPVNAVLAGEAIRALRVGLSAVVDEPTGLEGREHTLYGAYLSAVAFASAGSGLHHKICHVLGGMFNLPMRRRMPWCYRTCWRSTHPMRLRPNGASPRRSTRRTRSTD